MDNNALDNNAQMVASKPTQAPAPKQEQPNSAKDAIKAYLDEHAVKDPLFAVTYAKPNKNIDECFNYILGEARKRGSSVCMTDEEVFGLAVHYYDEDDIKVDKAPSNFRASTSRQPAPAVELTEEEKAIALEAAIKRYEDECLADERKKAKARKKKKEKSSLDSAQFVSPSLFDFDEI